MTTDGHLTFSKVPNYNGPQDNEGQCESLFKFPDDQSKPFVSYGDLYFLNMTAVRHLELLKF